MHALQNYDVRLWHLIQSLIVALARISLPTYVLDDPLETQRSCHPLWLLCVVGSTSEMRMLPGLEGYAHRCSEKLL